MTLLDYLKLFHRNIFIILLTTAVCLCAGVFASDAAGRSGNFDNTVFLSIGIQDSGNSTDSYENLQAADQITESIQGWFRDPLFQQTVNQNSGLNYSLKAKKQEKNNLLLNYFSQNESDARKYHDAVISELGQRLASYDRASDLKINLAADSLSINPRGSSLPLYLFITLLLGLACGMAMAFLYEYLFHKVMFATELKNNFPETKVFHYRSYKNFKKNYGYLLNYLNNQYSRQKIQIIDLTRKSKIGLEIISKHGDFQEVRSYDLPHDLEKIKSGLTTIIITEFGHTSTNTLSDLSILNFSKVELIAFDRI
jgi:capsular polysaccharide biosynthesis protein